MIGQTYSSTWEKGCNHKITTITEPDTDGTKTTADDYNDILGTWILTKTDTNGDKVILNFLITKSDSTYSVKVTGMTITDGVYVTEQGDGLTVDFDYATDGRTFMFSTPAFATLTNYASKEVVIGEDEDGLYITVKGLYEANGYGPSGYSSGDVIPMHNGDSLYNYTSESARTKIGSVAFSYDSTHKEHSYSAMSNALGFKTFNIHASASTSNITPAHYKECSCGVKYLEEACGYDSTHTGTLNDADNQRVCYFCGYSVVSGVYGYCTVSDGTSYDELMVKIGSEIVLPYTTYQFFNGENVKISGWTSFSDNASETGAGKVKITETGAGLVFAPVA